MTTIENHTDLGHAPGLLDTGRSDAAGTGVFGAIADWVSSTDHKRIGRLYLGGAALSFIGTAVVAILLGVERVAPDRELLPVNSLTQLFAIERFGFTYLVLLPAILGVALAIVPLQIGARSLALPRLAAAGFWAWVIGGGLAIYATVKNGGPGGSAADYVDLFTLATVLLVVGLLAGALSLATSILTTRAPGMNLRRVPFFTWAVLVASLGLLIALPVFLGDLLYVFIGHRHLTPSVQIVNELAGNRALDKWAGFGFTQPTTLLFVIPVLGFFADTVATASRQRLRPRGSIFAAIGLMLVAVFATVVQSPVTIRSPYRDLSGGDKFKDLLPFALVHGLPALGCFLALALTAQAIVRSRKITAPVVFGLLASFLVLSSFVDSALLNISDAGLANTTFEEGTWLAVVFAGVMAAMGAYTYWSPKWSGRALAPKLALPLALVAFIGAELASLSLMIAGFADQPFAAGGAKVFPTVQKFTDAAGNTLDLVVNFKYSGPMGLWNALNVVGISLVLLVVLAMVALAIRGGEAAGDDPWDGQTLEWATTSPAPAANFADIHIVKSAEPLLDLKPSNRSDA